MRSIKYRNCFDYSKKMDTGCWHNIENLTEQWVSSAPITILHCDEFELVISIKILPYSASVIALPLSWNAIWLSTCSLCVLFLGSKLIGNKTELDNAIKMEMRLLFLDFDIFRSPDHKQKQIFYFSIKKQIPVWSMPKPIQSSNWIYLLMFWLWSIHLCILLYWNFDDSRVMWYLIICWIRRQRSMPTPT